MTPISLRHHVSILGSVLTLTACSTGDPGGAWAGSVDTLPSGTVVVTNPLQGTWTEGDAWRVTPTLRVGSVDGDGPDVFGSILAIEVDAQGRLWIVDGQAQEIRVFDVDGNHVRTVGRRGGGPGEFNGIMGIGWGHRGHLWVVDPQNNRISILDTAGTFLTSYRTQGGLVSLPWPGGFDRAGHFYNVIADRSAATFRMAFVRHDTLAQPLDTLFPPEPRERVPTFDLTTANGSINAPVPFTPGFARRFVQGDFWFMHTGTYELFFRTGAGDTLLKVTKAFDPVPVTDADREAAVTSLEWFTRQGGRVDRSRMPSVKPAVEQFHVADDGTIWVAPTRAPGDSVGALFDVFARDGRYLGQVRTPFPVAPFPYPIIRDSQFITVTRDELGVPYVVVARIEQ